MSANPIFGTDQADKIYGTLQPDAITGGAGGDQLYGGPDPAAPAQPSGVTFEVIPQNPVYSNAVGCYIIAADGTISDVTILAAGATTPTTTTLDLPEGATIGMFVLPNAARMATSGYLTASGGHFEFRDGAGHPGNVNSGIALTLWYVDPTGKASQIRTAARFGVWHSAADPDNGHALNSDKTDHTQTTIDPLTGVVTMGFEEQPNGGTRDYDDVIVVITPTDPSITVADPDIDPNSGTAFNPVPGSVSGWQPVSDDDILSGEAGNDTLNGLAGHDSLYGGVGDDTLWGGDGNDTLWGEDGDDLIDGGAGDDSLYGGKGNDRLSGGAGTDRLWGEAGNDDLRGGEGNDDLRGGDGADVVYGDTGSDSLLGEAGNDALFGGDGADALDGGTGTDMLSGGTGEDALQGGDGDDLLYGDTGNDALSGGKGNDTAYGGDGHDRLDGQTGNDLIYGGKGQDTLLGGDGADTLYGDSDNDWLEGGAQNDILHGGSGSDNLVGQGGADSLYGGSGSDNLAGSEGNDRLEGGTEADLLQGGAGTDILTGGAGNDTLTGGAGADTFVFLTQDIGGYTDTITDFDCAVDSLDLSALGLLGDLTAAEFLDQNMQLAGSDVRITFEDQVIDVQLAGAVQTDALSAVWDQILFV